MARAINLFTIPPGAAFADELARGVLKRFSSDDPFALSRALILVPTQRSIDTIREAFARVAPGGVAVLPRIWALGEFDDAPLLDDEGEDVVRELGADLPPPLSRFRRELLLTRFVLRWLTQQEHERALGNVTPGQALELARDLAKLLDEATQEGLAWERLQTIVPHELSEHWERTLKFLGILTKEWPGLLDAENSLDPVAYRVAALRRTAARWREVPPEFPVIAAGSTGSLPATADLLRTIAYMPSGAVVLPGIDLGLDRKAWDAVEAGHPQHGMHQLLTRMDATRSDVQAWTDCASNSARARLLAEALRPAESTPSWRDLVQERKTEVELGLQGLSLVVARTPAEEALIIALALREAVETPNKTAALVTRDRTLARRVAGELKRWGIAIDDSAGVPLSQTLPGRFLQLIADVTAQEFAPVPLLALLKHPFSALGFETTAEVRLCTLDLEEMVLRGPRPASGIDGLKSVVHPTSPVAKLITQLDLACGGFAAAMTGEALDLRRFAQLHREAAELLSAVATTIELKLWEGDAGAAAFKLFERLMSADADVGLTMRGDDYAAFFRAVMDAPEAPVQPRGGQHPRLAILGTLEVRLQHADLMILGGLNEGVWPPATDPGPWLNRPMRRELDVSQPERRVGLSAHDFCQAAAGDEVLLTRAEKDGGAPTTPSRWLTRLSMLVEGAGFADRLENKRLVEIARRLDKPLSPPKAIEPPAPRPPVAARPRALAVTQVELWLRDPYALYAKKILKLEKLKPIDMDPSAAERGSVIHKALENFVKLYPTALPPDLEALSELMRCGQEAFGALLDQPGVRGFWWPRYERIARWFLTFEQERRERAGTVLAEQTGTLSFPAPGGVFTLSAKADRIELLGGGAIAIADYKTGTTPTGPQVKSGLNPQLTLEAAIALEGGFPGLAALSVDQLVYVALKGDAAAGEEQVLDFKDSDPNAEAAKAKAGLQKFVAQFDSPAQAYLSKPRVLLERHAGDYDHLARVKEWSSGDDDER